MLFPHYNQTKVVYHVIHINQLKEILENGIEVKERKKVSDDKYLTFNIFLDKYKPEKIPQWVCRERAFFASMNFRKDMQWHSHSALLAIKVQEEKCWIAKENLANEIYDPFILKDISIFDNAKKYLDKHGGKRAQEYWEESFSFQEYLNIDLEKQKDFDEEVMIFHSIPPQDIECLRVFTDHLEFTHKEWQEHYHKLHST